MVVKILFSKVTPSPLVDTTVRFGSSTYSFTEGETGALEVLLTGSIGSPVEVTVTETGGELNGNRN